MLERIIARVRIATEERAARRPAAALEREITRLPAARDFTAALGTPGRCNIIAEMKRASPSAGLIRPDLDPAALAADYQRAGAAALSVLTEPDFFRGTLADLAAARAATGLPVLQKDFILDRWQLLEARAGGADAVLLIAAVLGPAGLARLYAQARELGLAVLVETHDEAELETVLAGDAELVGINNRNLATLETDLAVSRRLLPLVPGDRIAVVESGLKTARELREMNALGAGAFLIGETLLNDPDPGAALAGLLAGVA